MDANNGLPIRLQVRFLYEPSAGDVREWGVWETREIIPARLLERPAAREAIFRALMDEDAWTDRLMKAMDEHLVIVTDEERDDA